MPRHLPAFQLTFPSSARLRLRQLGGALLAIFAVAGTVAAARAATMAPANPLAGTWTLEEAYDLLGDGQRTEPYGPHPAGSLLVGPDGRYSLQIFHTTRTPFASGDKWHAADDEYRAAVLGMSTHFGRIDVDMAGRTLTFRIERAAFPNWDGKAQTRPFELHDEVLSYKVPKTPGGATPVSVWRRVTRYAAAD